MTKHLNTADPKRFSSSKNRISHISHGNTNDKYIVYIWYDKLEVRCSGYGKISSLATKIRSLAILFVFLTYSFPMWDILRLPGGT